jgi:hypothetical protein
MPAYDLTARETEDITIYGRIELDFAKAVAIFIIKVGSKSNLAARRVEVLVYVMKQSLDGVKLILSNEIRHRPPP